MVLASSARLQQLRDVRIRLLRLHKALLDAERAVYERAHGPVPSNLAFLNLVLNHEAFAWLRPMSGLIALVDESLADKAGMAAEQASALLTEVGMILQPEGNGAARLAALSQQNLPIAQLHTELTQLLQGEPLDGAK
jgi:hypothetical protein